MPSLKRQAANLVERKTGYLILHQNQAHRLPSRLHLRRFFKHFGVDCVFDVGANVGQYATHIREVVGFTGPIISFEPIPELAATLREKAARDPQWHIESCALDREAGPATFHVMAADVFSSFKRPADDQPSMLEEMNKVARQIEVMRSTLAVELPRWRQRLNFRRPFLKVKTQGNDLAVVEGAGAEIRNFVGLQSDLAIRRIYADSPSLAEAMAAYETRGFRPSALVPLPDTPEHFPLLLEMDCIMFREDAERVG